MSGLSLENEAKKTVHRLTNEAYHLCTRFCITECFCAISRFFFQGWDDVSFHGSPQIPTPHIDKLANEGVILNSYYVSPICTPTRASLMTGKHPINLGNRQFTFVLSFWDFSLNSNSPQDSKSFCYRYSTRHHIWYSAVRPSPGSSYYTTVSWITWIQGARCGEGIDITPYS